MIAAPFSFVQVKGSLLKLKKQEKNHNYRNTHMLKTKKWGYIHLGYDLNITRANYTFEAKEHPITLEEWKNYISVDPDIELQEEVSQTLPNGKVLSMKREGMAAWNYNGDTVIFHYSNGLIMVRYHFYDEPAFMNKVKSIALVLNARLLGDEQVEF